MVLRYQSHILNGSISKNPFYVLPSHYSDHRMVLKQMWPMSEPNFSSLFWHLFSNFINQPKTPHSSLDIIRAVSPLHSMTKKTPRCKNTKGGNIYTGLQPRISQKLVKAFWPVLNLSFQSLSCIHIFPHSYGTASKLLYDVSILYWSRILA